MKRVPALLVVLMVVFGLTATAHATLMIRGQGTSVHGSYNLIYDSDLDITWYDYTNSVNSWQNQLDWAAALTVDFGGTTYSDWRLPTSLNQDGSAPCNGSGCTGSEMGHLYHLEPWEATFLNLNGLFYWSSTGDILPDDFAWAFYFHQGTQNYDSKLDNRYGIAVRSGDVSAVPEPSTLLLLGSGLAGLGYARRRFR